MRETWVQSLGWEGNGYSRQYSGLENFMVSIVHGVTKSWTWLSDFHFHCTFQQRSNGENQLAKRKEEIWNLFLKIIKSPGPTWAMVPVSPCINEKAVSPCCCCQSANPTLACQLEAKISNHEWKQVIICIHCPLRDQGCAGELLPTPALHWQDQEEHVTGSFQRQRSCCCLQLGWVVCSTLQPLLASFLTRQRMVSAENGKTKRWISLQVQSDLTQASCVKEADKECTFKELARTVLILLLLLLSCFSRVWLCATP